MRFKDFSRLLLLTSLAVMAACGGSGGSDDDDGDADCTGGYINIDPIDPGQTGIVMVTGTAFVSDSWYCDSSFTCYPRVEVTFENLSSGYTGLADSHYSGFTGRHSWTAMVPLDSGDNRFRFTATDVSQEGVYCAETVSLQPARTRVLETYPENSAENVHEYSVIAVWIDGQVDASKIDENSIVVRDSFGVAISGRIEVEIDADKQFSSLIFIPDYLLAPATQYRAELKADIFSTSKDGDPGNLSWGFTTWEN